MSITFRQIGEALKPVYDPEIRISVVDLGLIYGAKVEAAPEGGDRVEVEMSLTTPACPYGPMLLTSVHKALQNIPGVRQVEVNLSFNPNWDPRVMASEEAKDMLGLY